MNIYWIWLTTIKGVGNITIRKLLNIFGNPKKIYEANKDEVLTVPDISKNIKEYIINARSLATAEKILDKCNKLDIKLLAIDNKLYPKEVKNIKKMPVLLYYRGKIISESMGIGVIGSRRCTEYGKRVSLEVGEFLADNNIPIVTSLHDGINTYVQASCLNKNGYIIAFSTEGIRSYYSKKEQKLIEKIINNGAIISPYSPEIYPGKYKFIEQNALLSAWCKKLLVIEASRKSGVLITAEYVNKQGKEVLAVPNNIYSYESTGTNWLISKYANIYYDRRQLLSSSNNYDNFESVENKINMYSFENIYLNKIEEKILNLISSKSMSLEEIIFYIDEDKMNLIEILSKMELEGKVTCLNGGKYCSKY